MAEHKSVPETISHAASNAAEVIERAMMLIRQGQYGEALAYATGENRRVRAGRLEYHLVRWRNAAYGAGAVGPTSAPHQGLPDLFAGCTGIPEVAFQALSGAVIASAIQYHGCLLVRGLLSPASAALLAEGITRVFQSCEAANAGAPVDETLPWYAPFKPGDAEVRIQRATVQRGGAAVWTADSPRMLFDLLEVLGQHRVLEVVADYFGERPIISVEKNTLRMMRATRFPAGAAAWHQDGAFLGSTIRSVNTWIALCDCGVDAPGLEIVPRRIPYVVETGTDGASAHWTIGPGKVATVAEGVGTVLPVFGPGDALLFDHLLVHRTGVLPGMTETRRAIESWFFAPSTKPPVHHALVI